jgi:hypothetical protein
MMNNAQGPSLTRTTMSSFLAKKKKDIKRQCPVRMKEIETIGIDLSDDLLLN